MGGLFLRRAELLRSSGAKRVPRQRFALRMNRAQGCAPLRELKPASSWACRRTLTMRGSATGRTIGGAARTWFDFAHHEVPGDGVWSEHSPELPN